MKNVKVFARTIICLLITAIIIVACNFNFTGPAPLPQGDCPVQPEKEFKTFKFSEYQPKYIFILVDKSYQYTYTNEVLKYISEQFLLKINPGDRVIIAWMDLTATTASIFVNERVEVVDHPQFLPTPVMPLLTPTLALSGPSTTQNEQMLTNKQIEKENDVIKSGYFCEVGKWNYDNDKLFHQWENDQQNEMNRFLQASRNNIRLLETSEYEGGKLLYESLSLASRMINNTKENQEFTNYVLIVFSDMNEWRPKPPDDIAIDFANVEVAVAIHTCNYAIDCNITARWKNEFDNFNAVNPKFIVRDNNIPKVLNKFISDLP